MAMRTIGLMAACLVVAACSGEHLRESSPSRLGTSAPAADGLDAFASEREFDRLLNRWTKRARSEGARGMGHEPPLEYSPVPSPPPPPAAAPAADAASDTASRAGGDESITNVQTAGVDEGGIVKRHGDHLVVLRRGRLFTVRIGGDNLAPVASIDAFGPGTDPSGSWYDEMLVGGDTVVVIGYSYQRGGTELVLFDIGRDGTLGYRDTWHLRSNDYYSSRNYASRLIGTTLVFYTPMDISPWNLEQRAFLPGMRGWQPGKPPAEFKRILPATRIFRTDDELDPFDGGIALHTVTRCELATPQLECTASAVLGPTGHVFYVSADSVFVWTTSHAGQSANTSAVVRIPLNDATPTALKTRGVPIDQLSFLHGADGYLNVLLSAVGAGEGMWGDETSAGDLALLRVPLDSFGDGRSGAPGSAYRRLPGQPMGDMQNRYIGDWLLFGNASNRWDSVGKDAQGSVAHALRYSANDAVQTLPLGHGAERIEAMGRDAIVIGSARGDLHFTSVRLDAGKAVPGTVYVQQAAAQGESRTHGFFYRGESDDLGIVGLPVIAQQRSNTMQRYLSESASVLYLRNRDLRLTAMGQLEAEADRAVDDGCKASCVDWYGNARPIFVGDRVFALLGYELVEGRIADERIVERRRTSFAPALIAR
jgi:hypothetical protein